MKPISAEEMKLIQLDIMDAIHNFCVEHNITYSLSYGTLLGAVRHGGYIPWDDDVDIVMPRPDYERFLKEFNDPKGIVAIAEPRVTPGYVFPYAKLYDSRTIWYQEGGNYDTGIYVDVFPLDDLADTVEESLAFCRKYYPFTLFVVAKFAWWSMMSTLTKKIGLMLYKLRYCLTDATKKVNQFTQEMIDHRNPTSRYLGFVPDKYPERDLIERRMLEDIRPIKFEDREYLAIADYDTYLRTMYGNYMELPPEEDRKPHSQLGIYWLDK